MVRKPHSAKQPLHKGDTSGGILSACCSVGGDVGRASISFFSWHKKKIFRLAEKEKKKRLNVSQVLETQAVQSALQSSTSSSADQSHQLSQRLGDSLST